MPEEFRIRAAKVEDREAIRSLVSRILTEYGLSSCSAEPESDLEDIDSTYAKGFFDVLVDRQDQIVGTVALLIRAGTAELRRMYLVPEVRGHGQGKRLLTHAIARARESSLERIELETATAMVEAQAIYARFGFKPVPDFDSGSRCDRAFALDL